jgi:copper chaperone CopZ
MFRTALVVAALALSPAALACGTNSNCAQCNQAPTTAAVDVDAAAGTKVDLVITGMHCGACSSKIVVALTETAGVNAVTVDHETGLAQVAYDATTLTVDALIAAVATAGGFEASVVTDAS